MNIGEREGRTKTIKGKSRYQMFVLAIHGEPTKLGKFSSSSIRTIDPIHLANKILWDDRDKEHEEMRANLSQSKS